MIIPTDVATIDAWWQADSLTLADADPVSSWPDSGPFGFTATQATSGNQPTYRAAVLNGRPAVRFDGTNDYLTSTAPADATTTTLFAVLKPSSTGTLTIRGSDITGGLQYRVDAGIQQFIQQGQANLGGSTTAIGTNTFSILCGTFNQGVALGFYLNGATDGAPAAGGGITSGALTHIGRNGAPVSEYLAGDLAELIVYDSVLSTFNRAVVHSYLSRKYGIAVTDYTAAGTEPIRQPLTARRRAANF